MTTIRHPARRRLAALALLAMACLLVLAGAAAAQEQSGGDPDAVLANAGTAFTYQGRLVDDGNPASGAYDLQFRLYDASAGGSQIGGTVAVVDVSVSSGLFTAQLDFGAGALNGQARWLEIDVKRDADGSYTTLAPRVALTPAPHALALPGLWTQQNATSPNLVGGYAGNVMGTGVEGGVIAGGGVSGSPNQAFDHWSAVGGGYGNIAGSDDDNPTDHGHATVGGGSYNYATGRYSAIGGGSGNAASGMLATIGGGTGNAAGGENATVSGGVYNDASSASTTVGGGESNQVFDDGGTVSGGRYNDAGISDGDAGNQSFATVGGGDRNTASEHYATIGGGVLNTASGHGSTVGGGETNTASGDSSTVGGGQSNEATDIFATVSGGTTSVASGPYATVGGGRQNLAAATYATVAGGGPSDTGNPTATNNRVYDDYGTIGGGGGNAVGVDDGTSTNQKFATVGGGANNISSEDYTTVSGGSANQATYGWATVGGGYGNYATANSATVGGGQANSATGQSAVVSGGLSNEATNTQASIGGGATNSASGNSATIGGGFDNTASGGSATVPGGNRNTAAGDFSFAAGRRAKANHDGTFVWADSTDADYASTATDTFNVRAANGAIVAANNNGSGLQVINSGADGVGIYAQNTGSGKDDATLRADNAETSGGVTAYLTNNSNYATVHAYNGSSGEVLYLQNGGDSAGGGGGDFIKAVNESHGDTQFRVTTTGEVRSDIGFNTPAADFAEMLPAVGGLEPGDVLAIGPDGRLMRAAVAYQATVVGVYSTRPGFVGGMPVEGEAVGKIPLAVVGVVPVKVSNEGGAIRPGDLLAASNTPGHAMKARSDAPQGTVIGKALEGLAGGTDVILMLVILQ